MSKQIEIFTDGGVASEMVIQQVKELACPKCTILVHSDIEEAQQLADRYGVHTVPAVVMDGKIVDLNKLKQK